jgi:hypothetical protein
MKCPVPCDVCGEIIELDAAHFQTNYCGCRGMDSCTHGVCDQCLDDYEDEVHDRGNCED